jgi:hypothetical protein
MLQIVFIFSDNVLNASSRICLVQIIGHVTLAQKVFFFLISFKVQRNCYYRAIRNSDNTRINKHRFIRGTLILEQPKNQKISFFLSHSSNVQINFSLNPRLNIGPENQMKN